MTRPNSRITLVLLVIAAFGVAGTVIGVVGWVRALRGAEERITLESLSLKDRQKLVQQFFDVSTRAYAPAWFAPGVGYTLQREQEVTAWGTTFETNFYGFRSRPPFKKPGVFRVLFIGDSWTFGMGVSWEESFPKQFEDLANELVGGDPPIEAFAMAAPGWNSFNQIGALDTFYESLTPSVVVLVPTRNDATTAPHILPNGSPIRAVPLLDNFGSDHSIRLPSSPIDSFRYFERWRKSFARIRDAETFLESRRIPFHLFFVGRWHESFIHFLVDEAQLSTPYVIAPSELAGGRWEGPYKHGSPETYEFYAHMIYDALAPRLRWPPSASRPSGPEEKRFRRPPADREWLARFERVRRQATAEVVEPRYVAGESPAAVCTGQMDCQTGGIEKATTILIRRSRKVDTLLLTFEPYKDTSILYPLNVEISIPSPAGGTRVVTTIPTSEYNWTASIPMPDDIEVGQAMDVEIRPERITLHRDVMRARSVMIKRIVPRESAALAAEAGDRQGDAESP